MTHLYLIRHGENLANLTKEFSYLKVDYPLTPKGKLQAAQTALLLQDRGGLRRSTLRPCAGPMKRPHSLPCC